VPLKKEYPALLEAGFHDMTLEDVSALCVTPFTNNRRGHLFQNLITLLNRLSSLGLKASAWIDGSFVTEKPEPDDIDLVLILNSENLEALDSIIAEQILSELKGAKVRYKCDTYWTTDSQDNIEGRAYWRGLFGFFRDESTPKGIVRVEL